MKNNQNEELEAKRMNLKMLALDRMIEAIQADEWSDVAKLSKDSYAIMVKEDATNGASKALRFQMIASLENRDLLRRYVETEEPQACKRLMASKEEAISAKIK
jgi:hypothetical protein